MPNEPVVREATRIAYLLTEITVAHPELGTISGREAARLLGPLWVITAENPFSERLDPSANAARNAALLAELDDGGHEHLPAVGRSPDGRWVEASVAVLGFGRKRGTKLGKQFGQNAVFEVTTDAQTVHGCTSTWTRSRPLDVHGWQPTPYSEVPLAEVIREALDLEIPCDVWRFRQVGWRHDGNAKLPCDGCATAVEVFSALLRAKNGTWQEAKAIVCPGCVTARLPSHLSHELREAVYAWSDWRLAAADAAERPNPVAERRCYVIALVDPTGGRLSADKEWVYIGETGKPVEDRLLEHLRGYKASSVVEHHGTELRLDLMRDLPVHRSVAESRAYEHYLGRRLGLLGYGVKGAH